MFSLAFLYRQFIMVFLFPADPKAISVHNSHYFQTTVPLHSCVLNDVLRGIKSLKFNYRKKKKSFKGIISEGIR